MGRPQTIKASPEAAEELRRLTRELGVKADRSVTLSEALLVAARHARNDLGTVVRMLLGPEGGATNE